MLRLALAVVHLLALAIGFGAAFLWLGTGLWRYLGGIEKDITYYNHNHWFLAKMGLFVLIVALELWPMVTLIRWRRGAAPDHAAACRISTVSYVQAALVALMVLAAAAMARGYGA